MHRNRIHHRELRGRNWTSCWWRSSLVHVTQREVRSHEVMWQCRPLCSRQDQYFSFAEDLCVCLPKIWNSFMVCNRNRHLCLIYFHKKEQFMKPIPSIEVVSVLATDDMTPDLIDCSSFYVIVLFVYVKDGTWYVITCLSSHVNLAHWFIHFEENRITEFNVRYQRW